MISPCYLSLIRLIYWKKQKERKLSKIIERKFSQLSKNFHSLTSILETSAKKRESVTKIYEEGVRMEKFSTLLLISKALHQQILRSDEIFANYYSDFREHALEELRRLNGSLISGVPVHVPMELYECDDGMMPLNIEKVETKLHSKCSKNYQRLQQAVKDHNQTIESIERFSGHQRRQIRSNSNCRIC